MSSSAPKHWLVAYDIRCPKRLGRLHRYLRDLGLHLQYSVFAIEATDAGINDILQDINLLISTDHDDVRAYHLPSHCTVWILGNQGFPEGIILEAACAARMLAKNPPSDPDTLDLFPNPYASDCHKRGINLKEADAKPRSKGD